MLEPVFDSDHNRIMDDCVACNALRQEAGEHAPMYARKLGQRGWAGHFSAVERAFLKAHPPEWYAQALARAPQFVPKSTESAATMPEQAVQDAA